MTARAAIVVAAAAVGRSVGSAVRGVNAHRGMGGPIASAGAVREMNPKLHRVVPEVVLLLFEFVLLPCTKCCVFNLIAYLLLFLHRFFHSLPLQLG